MLSGTHKLALKWTATLRQHGWLWCCALTVEQPTSGSLCLKVSAMLLNGGCTGLEASL